LIKKNSEGILCDKMSFKKFFQDYGCCGGDRDDLSISSTESKKAKKNKSKAFEKVTFQSKDPETRSIRKNPNQNHIPSINWTKLDDLPIPSDPPFETIQTFQDSSEFRELSIEAEDYTTKEPIDFESLKQSIDQENRESEYEFEQSMLSKNSKKIHKETKVKAKAQVQKDPKSKRIPWHPDEDTQVLELVDKYGSKWAKIASFLPGRTGKQVRDRYTNKLKPNINKDEWTKEEERIFQQLYNQMGNKWSKIASFMPGRTEGQIKNRFYAQFRKSLTSSNKEKISDPALLSDNKSDEMVSNRAKEPNLTQTQSAIEIEQVPPQCSANIAKLNDDDPTHVISYQSPEIKRYHTDHNRFFQTPETLNSSDKAIYSSEFKSKRKSSQESSEGLINKKAKEGKSVCTCADLQPTDNFCLNNLEILKQYHTLSNRIDTIENLLEKIFKEVQTSKNL